MQAGDKVLVQGRQAQRFFVEIVTPDVRCQRCAAPIHWAVTRIGKKMPLDLEPVKGAHVAHFATCSPTGPRV